MDAGTGADIRPSDEQAVAVAYDAEEQRFVASVPGSSEVAFLSVVPSATIWAFVHTEVPEALNGKGVGGELVSWALNYVRERGLKVRPTCRFVSAYLRRHPAELDVVHPRYRRSFEKKAGDQ